jgi:hypothetical protein
LLACVHSGTQLGISARHKRVLRLPETKGNESYGKKLQTLANIEDSRRLRLETAYVRRKTRPAINPRRLSRLVFDDRHLTLAGQNVAQISG